MVPYGPRGRLAIALLASIPFWIVPMGAAAGGSLVLPAPGKPSIILPGPGKYSLQVVRPEGIPDDDLALVVAPGQAACGGWAPGVQSCTSSFTIQPGTNVIVLDVVAGPYFTGEISGSLSTESASLWETHGYILGAQKFRNSGGSGRFYWGDTVTLSGSTSGGVLSPDVPAIGEWLVAGLTGE